MMKDKTSKELQIYEIELEGVVRIHYWGYSPDDAMDRAQNIASQFLQGHWTSTYAQEITANDDTKQ